MSATLSATHIPIKNGIDQLKMIPQLNCLTTIAANPSFQTILRTAGPACFLAMQASSIKVGKMCVLRMNVFDYYFY